MYSYTTYDSPLGLLTLACNEREELVGLWIEGQRYFGASLPEKPVARQGLPVFAQAARWLDGYFAGARPDPGQLPLAPLGSPFRLQVLAILRQIPYGGLMTYGEIAKKLAAVLGRQSLPAQAVGGAVAHNPISIIIPCHRVVGGNGSLTGYAGGLEKKLWLLQHEGADLTGLWLPDKKKGRPGKKEG